MACANRKKPEKNNTPEETCYPSLLPLKSDVVFKMIFGDARHSNNILRAFLASALNMPASEFEDLRLVDPHTVRDSPNDKLGILDVKVQLVNKEIISVEIQLCPTPAMAERITFYTGRNLTGQISKGQEYSKISKVVTIVILDYDLIHSPHYHHIFRLYDAEEKVEFTDIMEIHTLELQKLPCTVETDAKEEGLLNWLRLIKSELRGMR